MKEEIIKRLQQLKNNVANILIPNRKLSQYRLAEDALFNRKRKFLTNYASLKDDLICYVFQNCTNAEIAAVSVKS